MKVTFDDVLPYFESTKIWCDDQELYFFRQAWETLENAGLSEYQTVTEELTVWLRACVLKDMFSGFCEAYREECWSREYGYDELPIFFNDEDKYKIKLGQIVGDACNLDFDSTDEAIDYWVSVNKYKIANILVAKIGPAELFVSMIVACHSFFNVDKDYAIKFQLVNPDEIEDDIDDDFEVSVDSYETYLKCIAASMEEVMNESDLLGDEAAAYNWFGAYYGI